MTRVSTRTRSPNERRSWSWATSSSGSGGREVERGVGLPVEEDVDEAGLVAVRDEGHPPSDQALVADGAARHGAERLAAGAAGAVAGPHLDVVGQGHEAVAQAGEQAPSPLEAGVDAAGGLVEQIGAADVAHEDEVAGQEEAGLLGGGAVGDEERQVLGGVAWRVDRLRAHVAHGHDVAVAERLVVEGVGPLGAALGREVQARARPVGELASAGLEVGVDVGLGHVRDPQAVARGEGDEGLDVATRVDHERLAGGLATDEVARLREVLVVDVLEQHASSFDPRSLIPPMGIRQALRGRGSVARGAVLASEA